MLTRIPIANLYYLLCYAWNRLEEDELIEAESLAGDDTTNLLAQLLSTATARAMRRGLNRDYQSHTEELRAVRGRLLFAESSRRLLLEHGRAMCEFDELARNNLPNRIVRATLELLLEADSLDDRCREGIVGLLGQMRDIEPIELHPALFRRVRLHRSNSHYGLLLSICELVHDSALPSPQPGPHRFQSFVEDHDLMAVIYEEFVRNFYAAHAPEHGYTAVASPKIKWVVTARDAGSRDLLPAMQTDVVLNGPRRQIIIDCKFYHDALTGRFGRTRLGSPNLYQIYSYVKNQRAVPGWRECEGLLLYPAVNASFEADFDMDGNRVRAATVDLDRPWIQIKERLLNLITS